MRRWRLVTTTFETGGDCHHHFFKVEFAIFGLQYAENATAAGAPPWTPLGELTKLLQTP